jgi:hypothetical protein
VIHPGCCSDLRDSRFLTAAISVAPDPQPYPTNP